MRNTEDVSTENATVLELMLETASNAEVRDQENLKITTETIHLFRVLFDCFEWLASNH